MLTQLFLCLMLCILAQGAELNNRPILGVLFQEDGDNVHQYLASSYVKWVEMAGARVVPIFIKQDKAYYRKLLDQVNGVLMPGGHTALLHSGYSEAADLIIETAITKFNSGIYFPVWGTCLSFDKLVTYFAGNTNEHWEVFCNVENVSLMLTFPLGVTEKSVKMFANDSRIFKLLANFNVTANYHRFCLSVDTFQVKKNLTKHFTLVSTSKYGDIQFVSTLEHKKYPIYATQWHPEKNQFEYAVSKTTGVINHDFNAIQIGQHFGNFLVNESKKNNQRFANKSEEAEVLIYNYSHQLQYNEMSGDGFEEVYVCPI